MGRTMQPRSELQNEKFPPRFAFCRTPFLTRDKGSAALRNKEARDIVKGARRRPTQENGQNYATPFGARK